MQLGRVIRCIRDLHAACSLVDQNGIERRFQRGAIIDKNVKARDAVTFNLDGTTISNVDLYRRRVKKIVFSWE